MIFYIFSLSIVFCQSFSYGAEGLKTISLKPYVELEYKVPTNYSRLAGCVHRTFKMEIKDPKNQNCNPMVENVEAWDRLVVHPVRPLEDCTPKNDAIRTSIINFFQNPLYVNLSLQQLEKYFDKNCMNNISYVSLIRDHTISYQGNKAGNYHYLPGLSINGVTLTRLLDLGFLVLLIDATDTDDKKIARYKENIDTIANTIFPNDETAKNQRYFRSRAVMWLDRAKTEKPGKQVIYVKDACKYLSYLKSNVNSLNLQAAVDCFNQFTETGQMKLLPFYTLPKYQLTGILLLLCVVVLYTKNNKSFILPAFFKNLSL
jgi:hypothetical protein